MNRVEYLLETGFSSLSHEDKLTVKRLGPYQPTNFTFSVVDGKQKRCFNPEWFKKFRWLTVNTQNNAFYCFNCLTFGDTTLQDSKWWKDGFTNLKNFLERANNHSKSASHLNSTARLSVFGNINFATLIDPAYRLSIEKHNEMVTQNRNILDKIIEAIKFCGAHELALQSHGESENSLNRGIFLDLLKLLSTLDNQLRRYLETSTVNEYTSAMMQNEILDCIYEVYIEDMKEKLHAARYVAVEVDDTTDVTCKSQFAIILRYVENCAPVERFLKFVEVHDRTGSGLAQVILDELAPYDLQNKLIAQSYDGSTVMSGDTGVQTIVREAYPFAHYIHCYSHQTNLVLQKLTTDIPQVNLFFANLSAFSTFFSSSPKRMDALREACNGSLLCTFKSRWDFCSRVLNNIAIYREQILDCLSDIQLFSEWDHLNKQEAFGLSKTLQDAKFNYFLNFFKDVFVHSDTLFRQFQSRQTTGIGLKNAIISDFISAIVRVRGNLSLNMEKEEAVGKRRRITTPFEDACEVCDILTTQLPDWLEWSDLHLALSVVDPKQFKKLRTIPSTKIDTIVQNYPDINRHFLETEIEVLYSNESFQSEHTSTVTKLFTFLNQSELTGEFQEVGKVLEILLATPIHTAEPERSFSTLKRIKSFARNATSQDKLNALAVLSVYKDIITKDPQFNEKVISKFALQENRRAQFMYKDA